MADLPVFRPADLDALIADLVATPGALLPILHRVQERYGFVPSDAIPLIARSLNLSRAEVHGVVTFYHYFRSQTPGRRVVQLCQAEACQAMGARALRRHVEGRLGIAMHATAADGAATLEPVYCLGNCALAPAMTVNGEVYGRVTPERFDAVLAEGESA